MKKVEAPVILLMLTLLTIGIGGCGSAEAIKAYSFHTSKANLEKAIRKVINSNRHIYLDSVEYKIILRRHPEDINDTTTIAINAKEYTGTDREEMLAGYRALTKIRIKLGQIENTYLFRYLGDEQMWNNSSSSEIFICEVKDKNGYTLSQGHNELGQFRSKKAKEFTNLFEAELISKVGEELSLQHSVE